MKTLTLDRLVEVVESGSSRDVLVVVAPDDATEDRLNEMMTEAIEAKLLRRTVVVLPPGCDLDVLDEEQMAEAGWVRAPKSA